MINPDRPWLRFGSSLALAIESRLLELLAESAQQPHDLVILAGDLGLLELGHLERHRDSVGAARVERRDHLAQALQDDLLGAQARRQGSKPEVGRDFRHGSGPQGMWTGPARLSAPASGASRRR